MGSPQTNYTQGYSFTTLRSHGSRTAEADGAFLLPHIRRTDRILDVGCGPGSITIGLAKRVPQGYVTGIDVSEAVIQQARERLRPDVEDRVSFTQADLLSEEGLPFADGTFDIVFASQLFPHLRGDQAAVAAKEMRRVLKLGGILASRDIADIHWYPAASALNQYFNAGMLRSLGRSEFNGGGMPVFLVTSGFEEENMVVGAGTTVRSGIEGRRAFAEEWTGRLGAGDANREGWLRGGVSVEGIERVRELLREWRDCEGAWCVVVQGEVVARK